MKKGLLVLLMCLTASVSYAAQQTIVEQGGVVDAVDKGKINANFTEVYATGVTNAALANRVTICYEIGDETTALTAAANKRVARAPFAFTLTGIRASVTTAPTGATILIDVNESGTTVISTKVMIDASEKTSVTAATPYVISDAAIADDAELSIDIDQIGSSVAGAGLKVCLFGTR